MFQASLIDLGCSVLHLDHPLAGEDHDGFVFRDGLDHYSNFLDSLSFIKGLPEIVLRRPLPADISWVQHFRKT